MTIERKSCAAQIKAVSAGQATVVIATLGVVDKDTDVILPGFFGEQHTQFIGTHDWGAVPAGKTRVYESGQEALSDILFNLNTSSGKDWHAAIKFDFDHPPSIQEYSFGFRVRDGAATMGDFHGRQVRFLGPLPDGSPGGEIVEVSAVMKGAGQRTRTLAVKEEGSQAPQDPPAETATEGSPEEESLGTEAKRLSIQQLLALLDSAVEHLKFVHDMRSKEGRGLRAEVIAMIDETSKHFDELRARVKLGPMERDSINEELEARYHQISADFSRADNLARSQEAAENEELARAAAARLERISAVLHR